MHSAIGSIGALFGRKEVDSAAAVGLCIARTMHQCAVFWVSYFAM